MKFHVLMEEDENEKECSFELEPTHLFFDIDFFHYFDEFFKNNKHISFNSQKFQSPEQSMEAEIIKNISFVLFDLKKTKESVLFLENRIGNVPQTFSEMTPLQGQTIYTVGSPYGVLSSELYKNMLHKGIISNVFKIKSVDNFRLKIQQKYLFTLDLLVISGNEGGAILDEEFNFFGMLLPPLSISNSDAKYISFGVNYNFILKLIIDSSNKMISESAIEPTEIMENKQGFVHINEYLVRFEKIMRDPFDIYNGFLNQFKNKILLFRSLFNICLIMYQGSWASGIILNRTKGIILTVSHIAEGVEIQKNPFCTIKFADNLNFFKARFIKKSKGSYDIGILQILDDRYFLEQKSLVPNTLKFRNSFEKKNDLVVSKTIYAVGYGIFSPSSFHYPMVSKGIISKIISDPENNPKLIESDCKIFNGYSGGGLFTANGRFIGMIVYNVKETYHGIKENINFSYHYRMFEELYNSLKNEEDSIKVIEENTLLMKKDEFIEKAGELQTRQNVPIYKVNSKL